MGRARLAYGRAVRGKAAGSANNRVHSDLATRGVDGGMERGAQVAVGGIVGGGEGKSDEVEYVATTGLLHAPQRGGNNGNK